jgi:hypothetical protein
VGATVDVSLAIVVQALVNGCIPLTAAPLVRLSAAAERGQAAPAALRGLAAPSAATCPAAGAYIGAALSTQFVASVGPTTVGALLKGVNVISDKTYKKLPKCVTEATLIPFTVISPPAANLTLQLAGACVEPSRTLAGAVNGGAPAGSAPLPATPAADDTLRALTAATTSLCSPSQSAAWTSTSRSCWWAAGQARDYQQVMCVCAGAGAAGAPCAAEKAAYQLKYFPPPPPPPPLPWLLIGCCIGGALLLAAAFKYWRWRVAAAAAAAKEAPASRHAKKGGAAEVANPLAAATAKKGGKGKAGGKGKGKDPEAAAEDGGGGATAWPLKKRKGKKGGAAVSEEP